MIGQLWLTTDSGPVTRNEVRIPASRDCWWIASSSVDANGCCRAAVQVEDGGADLLYHLLQAVDRVDQSVLTSGTRVRGTAPCSDNPIANNRWIT